MFNASLVPDDERAASFAPILEVILDPLQQLIRSSITAFGLSESSAVIFSLNALSHFELALGVYPFVSDRLHQLRAQKLELVMCSS